MSDGTLNTTIAQDLDAAVAAYQRQFGRERTIEKLAHMRPPVRPRSACLMKPKIALDFPKGLQNDLQQD